MARDTLLEMPHAEARAALAAGAPAFLFVNPVEFHGPHLSLHNDLLVSHGLARDLHARLRARQPELPFLSAGDLEVGVAPTHGRGSRHTPFDTACALLREACRALAELGATRVILLTFHGAPLHSLAIEEGVRLLERQGVRAVAPFNAALQTLLELDGARYPEAFAEIPDAQERAAMQRELFLDFHAGFVETSLALHYAPETVSPSHRSLPPCPAVTPAPAFARASALAKRVGAKRLALELELAAWGRLAAPSALSGLHGPAAPRHRGRGIRLRAAARRRLRSGGGGRLRGSRSLAEAHHDLGRRRDARRAPPAVSPRRRSAQDT